MGACTERLTLGGSGSGERAGLLQAKASAIGTAPPRAVSSGSLRPLRARRLAACIAIGAIALAGASVLAQQEIARARRSAALVSYPATHASAFLDTIGVNTHLSWAATPYANLAQVADQLNYIGIRKLRDDFALNRRSYEAVGALMAQGFKFDLISGGDLTTFVPAVRELATAHPGGVVAIEGPNEVDGWGVRHAGLKGYPAAICYQHDLFTMIRRDPVLDRVPVYNLTVAAVTSSRPLGDLSAYADYANVHLYYGGGQPAYGWSPYDEAYHWSNWLKSGRLAAPGRPLVLTETGASATPAWGGGVDENTQARQILNSLMDSARTGLSATYLYELVDGRNNGPADEQSHFGLFRWNGSPRPAAVALHNFTRILGGRSAAAARPSAASLAYSIQGVPEWGGHLLFRQADGASAIVVWAEPDIWDEKAKTPIAPPQTPITLELAQPAKAAIYDPLLAATPVQVLGKTRRVTLSITDHPLIVQLRDAGGD